MANFQVPSEDIVECARSIRPHLPELLGPEAEAFDQQLAALLALVKLGQSNYHQLRSLIRSNDKTRRWSEEFLSQPPLTRGDYQPLPGQSAGHATIKYICPIGNDFTRHLRPGEDIPDCRTHRVALVPADQQSTRG